MVIPFNSAATKVAESTMQQLDSLTAPLATIASTCGSLAKSISEVEDFIDLNDLFKDIATREDVTTSH